MASLLRPILGARADASSADLLARFGSISAIMSASREGLCAALGGDADVADALLAARRLASAGWREEIVGQVVDARDPNLLKYLHGRLHNAREERLHAIFLDWDDRYIRDEQIAAGSRSSLSLRTRVVVQRAFELGANKLILAHNHPSGCVEPSEHDRIATARFEMVARSVELELIDHLIVAGGRAYSMRHNRRLP